MEPRLEFTQVGKEFLITEDDTAKVLKEAKELEWQDITEGLTVGAMPGMGIKATIKQLGIPKVDQIAIGGGFGLSCEETAGYGFYGIFGHYKNADVKIYVLDTGVNIIPLFMEVWDK